MLSVWPPLAPNTYWRRPAAEVPFPLSEPNCAVFHEARQGLWHGARELLRPGDRVLMPAYHHGSEVEALARAGLGIEFYEGTEQLEPDEAELETLLAGARVRALHLTHYLGFPQDAPRWRAWCDERGLLLFEDAAQAWLATRDGRPVGSWGDLAIFSLYKTVGIPDGGAMVTSSGQLAPSRAPRLRPVELASRHWAWIAAYVPAAGPLASSVIAARRRREQRGTVGDPEFALGDPTEPAARLTPLLLRRIFDPATAERRRRNYAWLLERLAGAVAPPFDRLDPGASPFVFPVRFADKAAALRRLSGEGVSGLDLWSVPHSLLPQERFPAAAARRSTVVGLPVHQELTRGQLERVAAAAATALNRDRRGS
jgi:dTDP-4-amino-4,6-dideoxygalactose transaminase